VWVWFQPPLPFVDEDVPSPDDMDEDEDPDVDEEDTKARAAEYDARVADAREKFSGVVDAVSDMGTAAMVVAGYLGDTTNVRDDEEVFHNAMDVLAAMIGKKGLVYNQASEVLQQLLSPWSLPPDFLEEATEARTNAGAWEVGRILPRALFSGMPGILTTEVAQLAHVVRNILNESASVDDIRWLTPEELATDWVFERLLSVWKGLIVSFEWPRNNEVVGSALSGFYRSTHVACRTHYSGYGMLCSLRQSSIYKRMMQVTRKLHAFPQPQHTLLWNSFKTLPSASTPSPKTLKQHQQSFRLPNRGHVSPSSTTRWIDCG
jgi:hypothetical protein